MAEKTPFVQNTFCWAELAAPDPEAAKKFYGPLFGWEFEQKAAAGAEPYWIAKKGEDYCAGLFQGRPAHWSPNIAVASVDETVTKARGLGASIVEEARSWGDMGRSAVLRDPQGAEFSLWQAKEPHSAMKNSAGSFCWPELLTKNIAKAEAFYTGLFGWQAKRTPEMPNYIMFNLGETMVAGMMEITKDMAGATPNWITYFSVSDADAIAVQANKAKAEVHVPPKDIPQVGRFSIIADPAGATFAVIKLKMAQTQAKSA